MKANNGSTSLELRYRLAQKAFQYTATYDSTIAGYLGSKTSEDVKGCYTY
jgi:phosphoribosylaminoimidazolecarboxamide formyltransferase/IMP cyclohydrolase